jgi:hypothetical protein
MTSNTTAPQAPVSEPAPSIGAANLIRTAKFGLLFHGRQAIAVAAALEAAHEPAPLLGLASALHPMRRVEWRVAYRVLRDRPATEEWIVELMLPDVVSSTEARRV